MKIGFITLRDLAMLRPPLRSDAMDVLLALCTHTGEGDLRVCRPSAGRSADGFEPSVTACHIQTNRAGVLLF